MQSGRPTGEQPLAQLDPDVHPDPAHRLGVVADRTEPGDDPVGQGGTGQFGEPFDLAQVGHRLDAGNDR
ncbi:hypothetical protein SDC9_129634 [bioreactor metagenome]|uniref:Uncharacterized protein n=1 Tax=bioreactor metagenome TaxID=1076179 RepID=A0A645D0E5_9ZZZZ